jgi:hypothetical protein
MRSVARRVVGDEFDRGADGEADAEPEQAPAVADQNEDQRSFDEERENPDPLDDGDLLEAGERIAEDRECEVGKESADDQEGERAGVRPEIIGDLHPCLDARPAGDQRAEAKMPIALMSVKPEESRRLARSVSTYLM